MFNFEALRALMLVVAHPAFQGMIAVLSLIIAIISTIITVH